MYRSILVPVDGSATARRGLKEAIGLARAMRAQLVLLHVIDAMPMMVEMASTMSEPRPRDELQRDAESLLAAARALAEKDDVEVKTAVREIVGGPIADGVIEEARQRGCDLIVMGTHGRRGLSHLVLGSDAEAVVRRSEIPVLLVRALPR